MKKRILSLFTTLAMLCGFIGVAPTIIVCAAENMAANFNKSYTLGSDPGQNVVNVAQAQNNKTKGQLGYKLAWCAAFVGDCADLAGQGAAVPRNGLVSDLKQGIINAGGTIVTSPQAGDIAIYYCTVHKKFVHAGIMADSKMSYQGNVNDRVLYLKISDYSDGSHNTKNGLTVEYIRPAYKSYDPPHEHSYTSNITKLPTCTESGIITYTCTSGDSTYTEEIPAEGHSYVDTVVEPTLETKGYTEHKCGKCGHSYIDNYVDELRDESYTYVDKLPDNITPDNYEIQYKCSYETTSTQSPGDGWHKGALVSEGYENVGEPFETAKYVETSDNCVMLNYRYYHYCGGSTGTQANYESTGNLVHYDCIYPDDSLFYVKRTDMDGEYPWFVLGWKSNDKNVLCESGFSCDGTYGTHGQRTNAWYRMATYQRRQYVSYYTYTKSTKWGSEYDEKANKIEIRYKKKIAPYSFKGDGTDKSPYLITSKSELEIFRDLVNSESMNEKYGYASYLLTTDIDLENEKWIPIGKRWFNGETDRAFGGKFNGGNHTIKGLYVNETTRYSGFFGSTFGGVIENLSVEGTVINTTFSTGGIVGEICTSGGIIRNCSFIGDVTGGEQAVGGIVGYMWQYAKVENCYHIGKVICPEHSAGGIAGKVTLGEKSNISEIINCYHVGKISGISGSIVGIIDGNGTNNAYIDVINCYALKDDGAVCGEGEAKTLDITQLNSDALKKAAVFLGENYADNPDSTFINGYPVFKWQIKSNLVGDVNNDHEVNVSDIVMIQKWLTNKAFITNSNNADINSDGKVDVFDIISLKRKLLK